MARFVTGNTFGTTDTVTAALLNQAVNDAAISTDSVDGSTIEVNSNALRIKDNGVTAAKIAAGALTDVVYPVGSIFTTVTNYADSAAVVNAIGGTTWTAFGAGRVLVGADASDTDFDTAEETGGAKTVTLTSAQSGVPAHTHPFNSFNIGGSSPGFINKGVGYAQSGQSGAITIQNTNNSTAANAASSHTNVQPYIVVYMWKRTA